MAKSSIGQITVYLFAAIGAVASVVTIIAFFRPPAASLKADAYINQLAIPTSFTEPFSQSGDGESLVSFARGIDLEYDCNLLGEMRDDEQDAEDATENDRVEFCSAARKIENLSNLINSFSYGGAVSDIRLFNNGSQAATNIRIPKGKFRVLEIRRPSSEWARLTADENGQYDLPDLNPGEEIDLLAFSDGFSGYRYSTYGLEDYIPKISHADGVAEYTIFNHQERYIIDRIRGYGALDWMLFSLILLCAIYIIVLMIVLSVNLFNKRRLADRQAASKDAGEEL